MWTHQRFGDAALKIVLTGSSGRIGRAIFNRLAPEHYVIGIDRSPFSTTRIVADFMDEAVLGAALEGADAVIHAAALHAPHVGVLGDEEFERINVDGTRCLVEAAKRFGVRRFVFTSTTAMYGRAIAHGQCTWVDEETAPQPRSIYHRTKLAAEAYLSEAADKDFVVRVIRMSRCFPEAADVMAAYRLHRGIDARDVAQAHVLSLTDANDVFERFVISGATPFVQDDCTALFSNAHSLLADRVADMVEEFRARSWRLPCSIDRVYSAQRAWDLLGWRCRYGFAEVLAQLDRGSLEVLPVWAGVQDRAE